MCCPVFAASCLIEIAAVMAQLGAVIDLIVERSVVGIFEASFDVGAVEIFIAHDMPTMVRVVLPDIVLDAAAVVVDTIPSVHVDVDTTVTPIPMVPAPDAAGDGDTGRPPKISVHERRARIPPIIRRVVRIPPRPVDHRRFINWHVNRIGLGRLDDVGSVVLRDGLLGVASEMAA